MKAMDKITFNGKDYPVRWVDIPEFGERRIGVESLEDALFNKDQSDFVSGEAEIVDNMIFFYVPDEIMDNEVKVKSFITRHLS